MIIGGDIIFQERLAQHFKIQNWRLLNAIQPKDIKQMFKKLAIDVALLCLNDLKKDGLVLIKMIKKMCPSVQVITVNSPDQISLSIEGMKLGVFDDFLMPLDLDSLILRIRDACRAKEHAEFVKPSLLRHCHNLMVVADRLRPATQRQSKKIMGKILMPKNQKKSQAKQRKKGV